MEETVKQIMKDRVQIEKNKYSKICDQIYHTLPQKINKEVAEALECEKKQSNKQWEQECVEILSKDIEELQEILLQSEAEGADRLVELEGEILKIQ